MCNNTISRTSLRHERPMMKSLRRFLSCTWIVLGVGFCTRSASGLSQHPVGEWTSHVLWRPGETRSWWPGTTWWHALTLPCSPSTPQLRSGLVHQRAGLSEGKPTALRTMELRQQWIVGYANGGVDLRDGWGTTHLPDLRISQVTGDKRFKTSRSTVTRHTCRPTSGWSWWI